MVTSDRPSVVGYRGREGVRDELVDVLKSCARLGPVEFRRNDALYDDLVRCDRPWVLSRPRMDARVPVPAFYPSLVVLEGVRGGRAVSPSRTNRDYTPGTPSRASCRPLGAGGRAFSV